MIYVPFRQEALIGLTTDCMTDLLHLCRKLRRGGAMPILLKIKITFPHCGFPKILMTTEDIVFLLI